MFRAFARLLNNQPDTQNPRLFLLHPLDLTALLELAWDRRLEQPVTLGRPFHRSDLNRFQDTWLGNPALTGPPPPVFPPGQRPLQRRKHGDGSVSWSGPMVIRQEPRPVRRC